MTIRACPICGKPAQTDVRPFCSPRCADVDLNRWLSGLYSFESDADEDEGPATRNPPDEG